MVYTDDYHGYNGSSARRGTSTRRINHSERVYVEGRRSHADHRGVLLACSRTASVASYHSVSQKWLQGYVNEYVWRYNHRDSGARHVLDLIETAQTS